MQRQSTCQSVSQSLHFQPSIFYVYIIHEKRVGIIAYFSLIMRVCLSVFVLDVLMLVRSGIGLCAADFQESYREGCQVSDWFGLA